MVFLLNKEQYHHNCGNFISFIQSPFYLLAKEMLQLQSSGEEAGNAEALVPIILECKVNSFNFPFKEWLLRNSELQYELEQ